MTDFPSAQVKRPVSTDGGSAPVWARSGRELFYVSGTSMMAAAVRPGASIEFDRPVRLFGGIQFATAATPILGGSRRTLSSRGRSRGTARGPEPAHTRAELVRGVAAPCAAQVTAAGARSRTPSAVSFTILEISITSGRSYGEIANDEPRNCPLMAQAASTEPMARPRLSSHANRIQPSRRSRRVSSASRSHCSFPRSVLIPSTQGTERNLVPRSAAIAFPRLLALTVVSWTVLVRQTSGWHRSPVARRRDARPRTTAARSRPRRRTASRSTRPVARPGAGRTRPMAVPATLTTTFRCRQRFL